ncbi:MAG TPA: S8 family peptidase [Flavipsychrobacter sp.]|nr:S8 family peptidase [Flavipsychrobacter sp.]
MKSLRYKLTVCLFIFHSFVLQSGAQEVNFAKDHLIVKLKTTSSLSYSASSNAIQFGIPSVDAINTKYNCTTVDIIYDGKKHTPASPSIYLLKFKNAIDVNNAINDYKQTGLFQYIEPDYIGKGEGTVVPNDAHFYHQWALYNPGGIIFTADTFYKLPSKAGADIKMEQAWSIEEGDSSVKVAILDGGCNFNDFDLSGRLIKGWNYAYNNNDPTDDYGHGTVIASIIGANGNNNIGLAGVDWHCKMLIVKVQDSTNNGFYSNWEKGIYAAVDSGAKVINLSAGGTSSSTSLQDAIDNAWSNNVTVVTGMGNLDSNLVEYPAADNHVIAVGATDYIDQRAAQYSFSSGKSGSNYGNWISVVAPGNDIDGYYYRSNVDTIFNLWEGTSMSTAFVSALTSLLVAQDPTRTPDQIKNIIQKTADDTLENPSTGWNQYYGWGRINAYRALTNDTLLSVSNVVQKNDFAIYPNPTTGIIKIIHSQLLFPTTYKIMDEIGNIVQSGVLPTSNEINISGTAAGVYFISLNNKNYFAVKKILKIQ